MSKWVYSFGAGHNEGRADMRNLLGGKGANLAEMANIGLPVPPGFTISTELCTEFYKNDRRYPDDLDAQVRAALALVEEAVSRKFGDAAKPLLVSVRSGARVSMPGMMDTVLNLGLNDETVVGLAKTSGDDRFAWDSFRRFIQMFGSVVLGVDHHRFEEIIESAKLDTGVIEDTALSPTTLALVEPVPAEAEAVLAGGGKGPSVSRGPNTNPVTFELITAAAREAGIAYQVSVSAAGTGTDANAMQLNRAGMATGLLGVPLRYMHTPVELLSLKDVEDCARLMAGYCRQVKPDTDFTPR